MPRMRVDHERGHWYQLRMARPPAPERVTIKMSRETVAKIRELSGLVSRAGWDSLGIERSDPATMTAVTEAAVDLLYAKLKKGRRG